METIHRKTRSKAQVSMGSWFQKWPEEDEAYEVGSTSPGQSQMEEYCWEGQYSTRVVAP